MTPNDRATNSTSRFVTYPLTLQAEGETPPVGCTATLAGHASGWVVFARDHVRLPWPVAFRDSLEAFAAKTGHPATTARLHPADLATLGALATEAGLAVLTGGGVQVDAETWGLA